MTQTALEDFAELVRGNTNPNEILRLSIPQGQLDASVRYMAGRVPDIYRDALQDPRYLAYCQEQDRKEEVTTITFLDGEVDYMTGYVTYENSIHRSPEVRSLGFQSRRFWDAYFAGKA